MHEVFRQILEPFTPPKEECIKCGEESEDITRQGNYDQETEPYCSDCFMDETYGPKQNYELADKNDD